MVKKMDKKDKRIAELEAENERLKTERDNSIKLARMKTCTNCGRKVAPRGCCQWCHTWRPEME